MRVRTAIRWIVAIAWLACALLLERILTLGGITDTSQATQNPPLFLVTGILLIVVAVAIAIATVLGVDGWATASLAAGIAYVMAGTWLRFANDDDSGVAIVAIALFVTIASWWCVRETKRHAKPGGD